MPIEQKVAIFEITETLTSKPGELAYLIFDFMEKHPRTSLDDFFEDKKPPVRIHKNLPECEACSA